MLKEQAVSGFGLFERLRFVGNNCFFTLIEDQQGKQQHRHDHQAGDREHLGKGGAEVGFRSALVPANGR